MKKQRWLVLLAALLMPTLAAAQSVFDGTWKVDMNTAKFPDKPDVYLLKDGMYHCKTCAPAIDVKADGQDQKVSGHPYYDMVSIKVVDDRTVEETDKKNGKTVATSKEWVSADGSTMTFEFTDSRGAAPNVVRVFDPTNNENNVTSRITDTERQEICGAAHDALQAVNHAMSVARKGETEALWQSVLGPHFSI